MSLLESFAKIKIGVWQFWRLVTNANRDLPFYDYTYYLIAGLPYFYPVGMNQIEAHGDQKKYFVSKSTLVYATVNTVVKFNSNLNVAVDILAGVWYEFKFNIYAVYVTDSDQAGEDDKIRFYFDGVMVDEARRPE
jgi:hypothetical protein